jgi:hypothetical protein
MRQRSNRPYCSENSIQMYKRCRIHRCRCAVWLESNFTAPKQHKQIPSASPWEREFTSSALNSPPEICETTWKKPFYEQNITGKYCWWRERYLRQSRNWFTKCSIKCSVFRTPPHTDENPRFTTEFDQKDNKIEIFNKENRILLKMLHLLTYLWILKSSESMKIGLARCNEGWRDTYSLLKYSTVRKRCPLFVAQYFRIHSRYTGCPLLLPRVSD